MKSAKARSIDDEISRVVTDLGQMPSDSEEYERAVKNLETLTRARANKFQNSMSLDGVLAAATNILGILLVLNYEKLGVISSRALSFIAKTRV